MPEDAVLTPEALRAWRERLGLSQAEAAQLLGVVKRTLAGWEGGEYRIPLSVAYAVRWLSEPRPAFDGAVGLQSREQTSLEVADKTQAKPVERADGREAERENEG